MASRFVSAGGAELKAPEGLSTVTDDAWAKARKQVEESKKPREEGPAPGTQEGGISLYEHLQIQKAAKQEAFEEASKLRNQFRPLDDGEVDFLEGIKQKERLKAETQRRETAERLEAFRRERANAEGSPDDGIVASVGVSTNLPEDSSVWTTTKKRRKIDSSGKPESVKIRKLSPEANAQQAGKETEKPSELEEKYGDVKQKEAGETSTPNMTTQQPKAAKTLISYDSDSDD